MSVNLSDLRQTVQDCIRQQMYSSAVFWADKLCTLSKYAVLDDIYSLAEAFFLYKQYQRAIHLLQTRVFESTRPDFVPSLRFYHLSGQCLAGCKEWEEVLLALGEDDEDALEMLDEYRLQAEQKTQQSNNNSGGVKWAAAVCLQRARAYEALENVQKCVFWYQESLRCDVRCVEAFDHLVDNRMMSVADERAFLQSLVFTPDLLWIATMYKHKIVQQDHGAATELKQLQGILETKYGLGANMDLKAGVARFLYHTNAFDDSFNLIKTVMEKDPYNETVLPSYLCCLVELGRKSQLFYTAHQLVEAHPEKAMAWFGVGCYYHLIGKHDVSRSYFAKATSIDAHFAPAWIGYGHSFAMQDETDQAMSAYRTAERLFEGSHVPSLCIGIEYIRVGNFTLATRSLNKTLEVCPSDPLIFNELGVIAFKKGEYMSAVQYFTKALKLVSAEAMGSWEVTLFNTGHALRKLKQYKLALQYFKRARAVTTKVSSIDSAIGFTYHLMGELDNAIDCYHKALGFSPQDTFATDMLAEALKELSQ